MAARKDVRLVPKVLELAARTSGDPKWVGEIVLALVDASPAGLDKGQRAILAMCLLELDQRAEARAAERERKRRQRARKGGAR